MDQPELSRIATIYNRIAPTRDQRQGLVEHRLMGKRMRDDQAEHLRGHVLDIGCGTGPTLRTLTELDTHRVTDYKGIDPSSGMLVEARKAADLSPFPVELIVGNAEDLPFPDASFDTITASLVLCTALDPALALREMARVCKPDGRIVLLEHVRARNPLLHGMQRLLNPLQKRMLGCNLDRPTDRIVRELGFPIDTEETTFFDIFHLIVLQPPPR